MLFKKDRLCLVLKWRAPVKKGPFAKHSSKKSQQFLKVTRVAASGMEQTIQKIVTGLVHQNDLRGKEAGLFQIYERLHANIDLVCISFENLLSASWV